MSSYFVTQLHLFNGISLWNRIKGELAASSASDRTGRSLVERRPKGDVLSPKLTTTWLSWSQGLDREVK